MLNQKKLDKMYALRAKRAKTSKRKHPFKLTKATPKSISDYSEVKQMRKIKV